MPTDAEWTILTTFLGGEPVEGGKMKSTGTIEAGTGLWYSPNTGASNESDFTAVPAGYRFYNGTFDIVGHASYWWSSSDGDPGHAWTRSVGNGIRDVSRGGYGMHDGFSVRCLRD